jgi:hypothetical protein
MSKGRRDRMDKKKLVSGVVFVGIGLSLIAFGVYMRIVLAGNIIYGPLISMRILMWSAIVFGIILLAIGGIIIKKGTKALRSSR